MNFLHINSAEQISLETAPGQPKQVHLFDPPSINAINAALAARRPLLVLGEPGTGKSQLARAAAKALGRAFVHRVVDARTEAQDLLWQFDAVRRLADAQLAGALKTENPDALHARLALENYLTPGPLWWALNWTCAQAQADKCKLPAPHQPDQGNPAQGCVVLIDEIDKAEPEFPNALLEVLGNGEFTAPGVAEPIKATTPAPLILITSNEERTLPAAFLRRCLVLRLSLPTNDEDLRDLLTTRGKAHFPLATQDILDEAATQIIADRNQAPIPKPGQAEYLDLLRAVTNLAPDDPAKQRQLLATIAPYVLKTQARQD